MQVARTVRRWADREVVPHRTTHGEDAEALLEPAFAVLREEVGLGEMLHAEEAVTDDAADEALLWALCLEQVGRADCGLGLLLAVELSLDRVGADYGTERLAPVLPRLPVGDQVGLESLGGRAPQATARQEADTWLVTGEQLSPLCSGAAARSFAVVCAEPDAAEPLVALVPVQAPGVSVGPPILQTGLAAATNARVSLADAPAEGVLPFGPRERALLDRWLQLACSGVCTGALQMGLEILTDWAESRVIKGKGQPFIHNPLIAEVMAEVAEALMVCRALLQDLARRMETDGGSAAAGVAWRHISTTVEHALGRAMELMGSAGYAREWQLERYWRDVRALRGLLGSPTLARVALATELFGSKGVLA